ncbi:ABC transporter ATP-binding protein/permease [Hyphomicrobium sp. CS1BSMeth3]|uniref:ABC transporter ATP-binding protein/permease n=1 Tax=Hyphomicrobium sp. CS1BSMeth3 TaxID=1892844 RepID=UPI000931C3E3|nr:ABC transporter ATP-binding protein/permease [Hyphomicrobium sp. CS1BSMeth3]
MSDEKDARPAAAREGDAQPPDAPPVVEEDIPEEGEALEELSESERRRLLLWRFLHTARRFWTERGSARAWLLTAGLLAIILAIVGAAYAMNVWNREIFDALEKRNAPVVGKLALIYVVILAVSVAFSILQVQLRTALQRAWRRWLTTRLVARWLDHGRYYQLNLVTGDHKNPEARMSEDMRIATEAPIDFVSGVLQAFLSAVTFIVVLWTIGGALDLSIIGIPLVVPGFLVIAAVLYAVIASGAMVLIGSRFVQASEAKNQNEAEFRYVLTRVRENGESIALIRGEEEERAGLQKSLSNVLAAWRRVAIQTMKTTAVSQTSSFIAPVLPIILCAPKFLDGSMSLGQIMQAASAFTIVQAAFNWVVDNYPRLADWTASAVRVGSLMASLDTLERAEKGDQVGRIAISNEGKDAALRLNDLSVALDDGTAILDETEVEIMPGERVLIAGESGTGKSTLVRALAGLWPWGGGSVEVKEGASLFLLPQRPYVPVGSLKRAATYPEGPDSKTDAEVAEALETVGLAHLVEKIAEEGPWDQTLSGGEKQRLAIARILLHSPDIVVLDEATAALDPNSQDELMALLVDRSPNTTIVSVGHRPELEAFHTRKLTLARRREGARLVRDDVLRDRRPKRSLTKWLFRRKAA